MNVIVRSFDDFCPKKDPVSVTFELQNEIPILSEPICFPPLFQNVVQEEISKVLISPIIMLAASASAFPIVLVTKTDGRPQLCTD